MSCGREKGAARRPLGFDPSPHSVVMVTAPVVVVVMVPVAAHVVVMMTVAASHVTVMMVMLHGGDQRSIRQSGVRARNSRRLGAPCRHRYSHRDQPPK